MLAGVVGGDSGLLSSSINLCAFDWQAVIEIKYQQGSSNESRQEAMRQGLMMVGGLADPWLVHACVDLPLLPALVSHCDSHTGQPSKQASGPAAMQGGEAMQAGHRPNSSAPPSLPHPVPD